MLDLTSLAKTHEIKPRGVIHIGAHEGKELARYREMGFQKILFVEADPEVFARLQKNVGDEPGVILAQCAVGNTSGRAASRVTSMDHSSSLLPLKRHKTLYPDIVETQTFEVRTVTLDALLAELPLDPAEFNFLNIDIQDAELLALQGADKTLTQIDAINTAVNFEERYEGCAQIEEIDAFLEQRGFRRVALTTPFHPSWGDAFYVRQPVITMSSLGRTGRFGNQLFQYTFLQCYAREHDLRVETPPWVGQQLFGLHDPPTSRRLPEVRERSSVLAKALVPNAPEPFRNVDFWGYFQYNSRYYAPHKEYFRSLFRPTPDVLAHVGPMLERLRRRGKTIVGLHLRRLDYGYEQSLAHCFVAPSEWYLEWLRAFWPTLDQPVLFVASDEPQKVLADFAEFNPITEKDLGGPLATADFYPDFFLLSQCDALAISNSSFSFAAAMLNQRGTMFARPHLPSKRLIPFDPWSSEPLFRDAKPRAVRI
jgi:FkbM family methyltransferase